MSNFRSPVKVFISTLHKAHYSSSNKILSYQLVKEVQNEAEDKTKTENLLNPLSHLQHGNYEYISKTNVTNIQAEGGRESQEVKSNNLEVKLGTQVSAKVPNETTVSSESLSQLAPSTVAPVQQDPPQSLPVLMVAMVTQAKSQTLDLSKAMLPLSLHLRDKKGLLVDAVVQDMKHFYFKTSSSIDGWYLEARKHGQTFYISAEEYVKRRGIVQDFLRGRASSNAISVYDPKLAAIANIDVNGILEKIKQLIENITASIKKMFEKEQKPSGKEEKKTEEKSEKTEKKVEGEEKTKVEN